MNELKKGKFEIVVKEEKSEEKKEDHGVLMAMLLLFSASISLFISIGGDFTFFNKGFRMDIILMWGLLFPLVFTFLYILTRKKLNL